MGYRRVQSLVNSPASCRLSQSGSPNSSHFEWFPPWEQRKNTVYIHKEFVFILMMCGHKGLRVCFLFIDFFRNIPRLIPIARDSRDRGRLQCTPSRLCPIQLSRTRRFFGSRQRQPNHSSQCLACGKAIHQLSLYRLLTTQSHTCGDFSFDAHFSLWFFVVHDQPFGLFKTNKPLSCIRTTGSQTGASFTLLSPFPGSFTSWSAPPKILR